ncbi:hypothetical protein FB451DRAFT_1524158 [Mycena latifolia]|nr:hypothetical protein FB451DRAFT_1524158 [Mycena latifolia]
MKRRASRSGDDRGTGWDTEESHAYAAVPGCKKSIKSNGSRRRSIDVQTLKLDGEELRSSASGLAVPEPMGVEAEVCSEIVVERRGAFDSAECRELLKRRSELCAADQAQNSMLKSSVQMLKEAGRSRLIATVMQSQGPPEDYERPRRRRDEHPPRTAATARSSITDEGERVAAETVSAGDERNSPQAGEQRKTPMENLGLCTNTATTRGIATSSPNALTRFGREAEEVSSQMALGAVTLGQTQPMCGGCPRTGAGELQYNRALATRGAAVRAVGVDGVHINGGRFDEDEARDDDKWDTDRRADVAEEVRMRLMQREYGECGDELHTRRRDRARGCCDDVMMGGASMKRASEHSIQGLWLDRVVPARSEIDAFRWWKQSRVSARAAEQRVIFSRPDPKGRRLPSVTNHHSLLCFVRTQRSLGTSMALLERATTSC